MDTMKEYKDLLKAHNIKDKQVGEWFGYSSKQSWHSATRRNKVIAGIMKLLAALK